MKVGDKVFIKSKYGVVLTTIERETKTQWVLKNKQRFRKDTLRLVGESAYNFSSIEEATPEKIEQFLRHKKQVQLKIEAKALLEESIPTIEQLEKIIEILKGQKNEDL
jgi:hypothetical protein